MGLGDHHDLPYACILGACIKYHPETLREASKGFWQRGEVSNHFRRPYAEILVTLYFRICTWYPQLLQTFIIQVVLGFGLLKIEGLKGLSGYGLWGVRRDPDDPIYRDYFERD